MFNQFGRRAAVVIVVVLLLAAVPVASAQEVRSGGSVTVPEGTVVDGLDVFGGTVTIAGTVEGPVDGFAGTVVVTETGRVTGDLSVAAGSVVVRGAVDGTVSGAAGDVTVAEGATVGGDLQVGAGSLTIAGSVGGTVEAGVESLVVAPTAAIGGDLRYDTDDASIADGASVAGVTERVDLGGPSVPFLGDAPSVGLAGSFVGVTFWFLANSLLAVVLLLAAPGFARRVTDTGTDRAIASGLAGLVTVVAVPVLLVLTAVTIVGIPLSIAGFVVSLPFLWVALVYGALVVGSRMVSYFDITSPWAGAAVGLLVTTGAAFIPLGGLVTLGVLLLGLGAFVLAAADLRLGRGRGGDGTEPATRGDPDDGSDTEPVAPEAHGETDDTPADGNGGDTPGRPA